jgi:hypothetical protein
VALVGQAGAARDKDRAASAVHLARDRRAARAVADLGPPVSECIDVKDPTKALLRLERFIEGWPHESALVGGLAMIARVRTRTTMDADVVIIAPPPPSELLEHARASGYEYDPEDIEEWFEGGLVRLRAPEGDLDLIIADDPFLVDVATRASTVTLDEATIPVAQVEDLLLLKLAANRPIDLDDALAIRDSFKDRLDREYLRSQGETINVDAIRFLDSEES